MSTDQADVMTPSSESTDDKEFVREETAKVKEFARELSLDDLRQGTWFAKLLTFSLDRYVREVDAASLRAKYPNLPPDAVVDARIALAARYASIEGGLSAAAYTGAVAATIGSGGGASPLTLPAGGASFVVDLTFTTQLQLRLAYDIAVLYGIQLDLNDPEDLWKLIRVAFVINAGEISRGAASKGVPALVRPIVKKIFSGSTLAAAKSLPVVGKHLLQRNIIKFAVPAIGVPVSAGVNYWSTRVAGRHAKNVFRTEARVIEAARRITDRCDLHDELPWVLWLVISEGGAVRDNQRLLLKHVTRVVAESGPGVPALDEFRTTIDLDRDAIWAKLGGVREDRRSTLYDAAVTAAVLDGKVDAQGLATLKELAALCAVPFDDKAVRDAARRNRD